VSAGDSIEDTVAATIAAVCRVPRHTVTPSTLLLDLAMDSLTLVAALTQIEAALEVALAADDLAEMLSARRVGDLARVVTRRRAAPAPRNSSQS
jgi:acyl carrier protein